MRRMSSLMVVVLMLLSFIGISTLSFAQEAKGNTTQTAPGANETVKSDKEVKTKKAVTKKKETKKTKKHHKNDKNDKNNKEGTVK